MDCKSYAESRQVRHIRVVFCDAHTYDQGIMSPEDLAGAVRVQGRGGTVLQPGIDLLNNDKSFPRDAPLLIITDGACDHLNLHGRTHAYLLPKGNNLPFSPNVINLRPLRRGRLRHIGPCSMFRIRRSLVQKV